MKIIFTDTYGVPTEYAPQPAQRNIPQWYKELESYMNGQKVPLGNGAISATIKKCMPVFDAMSSGYLISTYTDIFISQKEQLNGENMVVAPWYEWPSFNVMGFHPIEQAPNHPNRNGHQFSYPKFLNPWSIKTPPGYSCLFISPLHRDSNCIILPGIVDTDSYIAPVNFPFVLKDVQFSGLIPAGTPIAQVIPFKRESWEMKIGGNEEVVEQSKVTTKLRTRFFDSYKSQYRQIKEYK